MKTILTLALSLAATVAVIPAAPAGAQIAPAETVLAVDYGDLDLRTEAGVRAFDRRILTAVQQACGPISNFDLAGANAARECRADALGRLAEHRRTAIAAAAQRAPERLAAR